MIERGKGENMNEKVWSMIKVDLGESLGDLENEERVRKVFEVRWKRLVEKVELEWVMEVEGQDESI